MSRFYRALQQASPDLREKAGVGEVESGKPEGEAAQVLHFAEAVDTISPADASTGGTHSEAKERTQVLTQVLPAAGSRSGSFGVRAGVVLDQAAPLIPHAIDGAVIEYYRRLRAKIIQEQERQPFRSLVVTSPAPQDGKSLTVLNLALSFGMLPGYRVLLVDGDLRKGTVGKWMGVGDHPGLNNLIEGSAELEDVVLKCDEIPFCFMVRGSAKTPPAELLHSSRLIPQLRKMTEHFSLVLIDTPPVNLVADAQQLAAGCDAVLLVARAFATTRKALQKAVQDLSTFRVIGTVLNRGMRADLYSHYKDYK
jgi:capsular exopolysaccharide synthesis family protein